MSELRIETRTGETTTLTRAEVEALAARLRGTLILKDNHDYDAARSIWNGMIDKRPAAIARCANPADVAATVRFARERDLCVSVRSVGHNIAGSALCDGGLVIDLSHMKGIRVDRRRGRAWAQPGADWGDLDTEAQAIGRIVPGGIVSTTGIAGLTLGGGFGWLTRKYGFTCDSLLSADVVTADGERRTASLEENPDLFWGLRGAGGNFGVVTSFEYALQPLGPEVVCGLRVYPMAEADRILRGFRELTRQASDDLSLLAVLRYAPPLPVLPPEVHGQPIVAIVACHAGSVAEGERTMRPLRELGEPLADTIGPKPFAAHQSMFDAANPSGRHYYWKSEYLGGLQDGLIDVLGEFGGRLSSPHSAVLLMHLGGQARRVPADATSATNRDAEYILNIASSWIEPGESERHVAFTREFWRAVRPFGSGGTYVNFLTADDDEARVRAAFGPSYDRLAALKGRYDPDEFFRPHQSVRPLK
jgi:FAD/FMN-containing dehydrogenase